MLKRTFVVVFCLFLLSVVLFCCDSSVLAFFFVCCVLCVACCVSSFCLMLLLLFLLPVASVVFGADIAGIMLIVTGFFSFFGSFFTLHPVDAVVHVSECTAAGRYCTAYCDRFSAMAWCNCLTATTRYKGPLWYRFYATMVYGSCFAIPRIHGMRVCFGGNVVTQRRCTVIVLTRLHGL